MMGFRVPRWPLNATSSLPVAPSTSTHTYTYAHSAHTANIHTYTHTEFIHTYRVHTHIHKHMHTYTHTRIHTYTRLSREDAHLAPGRGATLLSYSGLLWNCCLSSSE